MMLFLLFLCIYSSAVAAPIHYEGDIPYSLDTVSLSREYDRIATTVGLDTQTDTIPITVFFYRTHEQRKLGIALPEWGGGGAIGTDTIVLPIDKESAFFPSDMRRIIIHEMVHIAIARAYGKIRVPRWFHEGMAMTLSGELSFEQQLRLSHAILLRSLVPLDSIEYLNRFSRWRAGVAYSQCHFAVSFLVTTYGIDLIPELLSMSKKHRHFENACVEVFGLTTRELQNLLDSKMNSRYRILFIIGDYSVLWAGIFLLSVVAFIFTMLRKRNNLRVMEAEEKESIDTPTP